MRERHWQCQNLQMEAGISKSWEKSVEIVVKVRNNEGEEKESRDVKDLCE